MAPTSVAFSGRWRSRPQHQARKSALVTAMSAFPPIATKLRTWREVRLVPTSRHRATTLGLKYAGRAPADFEHSFSYCCAATVADDAVPTRLPISGVGAAGM